MINSIMKRKSPAFIHIAECYCDTKLGIVPDYRFSGDAIVLRVYLDREAQRYSDWFVLTLGSENGDEEYVIGEGPDLQALIEFSYLSHFLNEKPEWTWVTKGFLGDAFSIVLETVTD